VDLGVLETLTRQKIHAHIDSDLIQAAVIASRFDLLRDRPHPITSQINPLHISHKRQHPRRVIQLLTRHVTRRRPHRRTPCRRLRFRRHHHPTQPTTQLLTTQLTRLRRDRRLHPRHIRIRQHLHRLHDPARRELLNLPRTEHSKGCREPSRQRDR